MRDDDFGAVGVDIMRRQRIGARGRPERPVGADGVVALLEGGQAVATNSGVVVQPTVDLLGLQGLMKALQETELGRGAIADADMAEIVADMGSEAPGEEGGAVVGDQERRSFELAMDGLDTRCRSSFSPPRT